MIIQYLKTGIIKMEKIVNCEFENLRTRNQRNYKN